MDVTHRENDARPRVHRLLVFRSPQARVPVYLRIMEAVRLKRVGYIWESAEPPLLGSAELHANGRLAVGICVSLTAAVLKDKPELEGVLHLIVIQCARVQEIRHGEHTLNVRLRLGIVRLVLHVPDVRPREGLPAGHVLLRLRGRLLHGVPVRVAQVDMLLATSVLRLHVLLRPPPAVLRAGKLAKLRILRDAVVNDERVTVPYQVLELILTHVLYPGHGRRALWADGLPRQTLVVFECAVVILCQGRRVL
mmetsp:Transcript_76793/g.206037  ORF Transcript_76793/g.206037 Transcript_76793/m.206037 type:complete len:251 (+) Transcript_76793:1148-1900(+)